MTTESTGESDFPFVLHELLGEGGMGQVWAAVHRPSHTPVALKVLRSATLSTQLANEVRAAAALDHPHLVRVLDFGELPLRTRVDPRLEPGRPWMAMERVHGTHLGDRCGRLAWPQIRGVLLDLLDGLAHAHARNVLHRDIKPTNVLLGAQGAKLSDFGIAAVLERAVTEPSAEDEGMLLSGTPAYMAPEQCTSDWRAAGPATDLYALGALAWALATGRGPIAARTPLDARRAHADGKRRPFEASVALPDGFRDWIEALLERDPGLRPDRAADVAWSLASLGGVQRREPTAATKEERERPTLIWSEQNTVPLPLSPRLENSRWRPPRPPPLPTTWLRPTPIPPGPEIVSVGARLFGLRTPPFEGRDAERDVLWALLRDVVVERQARCAQITGRAGSGRRRLAGWLAERAHELGVASVVTWTGGATAARLLHCEGLDLAASIERAEAWLDVRGGPVSEAGALVALFRDDGPVRFGGADERGAALNTLLSTMAAGRPVIVLLDPDTTRRHERWLRGLRQHATLGPVLVLVTVPTAAADVTVALPPLEVGKLTALACALLPLERSVAARVAEAAQGSPRYVVQVVKDWVDRRVLRETSAGYVPDDPTPADLDALRRRRVTTALEGLDPRSIVLAERLAVLGPPITDDDVAALSVGEVDLGPALERWAVLGLLRRAEDGWDFGDPALQQSLVDHAEHHGRLRAHHAVCADLHAALRPDPAREGQHRIAAGDLRGALAPLLKAADRLRVDAEDPWLARTLLDTREEAARSCALPPEDPEWAAGWTSRAWTELIAFETEAVEAWTSVVLDRAPPNAWRAERARALWIQARLRISQGRRDEVDPLLDRAEQVLGDEELPRTRTELDVIRAELRLDQGRLAEAVTLGDRAIERASHHEDCAALAIDAALVRARALLGQGRHAACREALDALDPLLEANGTRRMRAVWWSDVGDCCRHGGDLEAAAAAYRSAQALWARLGVTDFGLPELNLGLVLVEQGRTAQARRTLEACIALFSRQRRHRMAFAAWVTLLPALAADHDDLALDAAWQQLDALAASTFADPDLARCAELAATRSTDPLHRRRAAQLATRVWTELGRTDDARRAAGLLEPPS